MRRISALLALLLVSLVGCASPHMTHGIPNLDEVEPGVWRGGQPTAEGWDWLASNGKTNIIKLNTDAESQGDDMVAALHPDLTIHYFPIPFSEQFFGPPPYVEVMGAVDAIKPGTFIHCTHGQDRTGLVVAEYRVWRCGWTREQARKEMLEHGFHRILFGLDWFWRNE